MAAMEVPHPDAPLPAYLYMCVWSGHFLWLHTPESVFYLLKRRSQKPKTNENQHHSVPRSPNFASSLVRGVDDGRKI